MKKNMKANLSWVGFMVLGFAVLGIMYTTGLMSPVLENTLVMIGINIILAVGLNLVIGISGQFSLGHAGFMAIGAYATAIFSMRMPTMGGFISGLLIGAVLAGFIAYSIAEKPAILSIQPVAVITEE